MAQYNALQCLPFLAAADLSALQYTFVTVTDEGVVGIPTGAGDRVVGILQNAPLAGEVAEVAIGGQSKIKLGATVAPGAYVMTNAAGLAVAVTSTNQTLGVINEGGAVNNIGSMVFQPSGVL